MSKRFDDRLVNTIAFYDIDPKTFNTKGWYEFVLSWFDAYQQIPTRMALEGEGVKKSNKTRTFKYYDKVIRELEFQGITNLWMGSTPEGTYNDYSCARFSGSFDFVLRGSTCILTFDNIISPYSIELTEKLVQNITRYFQSQYAVFYQRHAEKGPTLYAQGVICNGEYPGEDRRAISRWFHKYGDPNRYKVGDLRDVYPMNFISDPHLKREVNGQSLQDWINSSPNHGTLKPLTDTLWSWVVPEDKTPAVRDVLNQNKLLVVYYL